MWGLRVPLGVGDRLVLSAVRASGGYACAVSDEESAHAMRDIHRHEGIDATEEGGATLAALRLLRARGVALPLSHRSLQYG